MSGRYYVVGWRDPLCSGSGTREYGARSSKVAAIRLAERVLPAGAEYLVTTISHTVHEGRVSD